MEKHEIKVKMLHLGWKWKKMCKSKQQKKTLKSVEDR